MRANGILHPCYSRELQTKSLSSRCSSGWGVSLQITRLAGLNHWKTSQHDWKNVDKLTNDLVPNCLQTWPALFIFMSPHSQTTRKTPDLDQQFSKRFTGLSAYQKIIFSILNQNICCGYSKERSQWNGSLERTKDMPKLMSKKIFTCTILG